MARAGAFAGVDVVLTWHPSDRNQASLATSQANISARFRFHGVASHAAIAPEMGRSALDGLLLFNHAVEMLREHVPEGTRMHYIISNGGAAPNIVPDFAEDFLYLRFPGMVALDGIWQRILKAAEGSATATETKFSLQLVNSVYNVLPNDTLAALAERQLQKLGGFKYTDQEQRFAEEIRKTVSQPGLPSIDAASHVDPMGQGRSDNSTDFADISWQFPSTEFSAATMVPGIPLHSWQATACAGTSIGRKGMVLAAKTLFGMAQELYQKPELLMQAKQDFDRRRSGHTYSSRLPADARPPFDYRKATR